MGSYVLSCIILVMCTEDDKSKKGEGGLDYTKYMIPIMSSSAPEHVGEWTEVAARHHHKRQKKTPTKEVHRM